MVYDEVDVGDGFGKGVMMLMEYLVIVEEFVDVIIDVLLMVFWLLVVILVYLIV